MVDHARRDGVEVDGRRAATDEAVHVHERARVPPLAVDEHQCLIGREAAQGRWTHMVGAVADRCARKVERGRESLNHLRRLDAAGLLNVHRRQHVNRHRRVDHRPLTASRPDHGDGVQIRHGLLQREVLRDGLPTDDGEGIGHRSVADQPGAELVAACGHAQLVAAVALCDRAALRAGDEDRRSLQRLSRRAGDSSADGAARLSRERRRAREDQHADSCG